MWNEIVARAILAERVAAANNAIRVGRLTEPAKTRPARARPRRLRIVLRLRSPTSGTVPA